MIPLGSAPLSLSSIVIGTIQKLEGSAAPIIVLVGSLQSLNESPVQNKPEKLGSTSGSKAKFGGPVYKANINSDSSPGSGGGSTKLLSVKTSKQSPWHNSKGAVAGKPLTKVVTVPASAAQPEQLTVKV